MTTALSPPSATALPASPFKGLAPFEDSSLDAMLFFGREREREIITANLLAARTTVLHGASGVGKTSVLRAGVAYELRRLDQESVAEGRGRELAVVVFGSWSGDPLAGLRAAVTGQLFDEPADRRVDPQQDEDWRSTEHERWREFVRATEALDAL